MTDALIEKLTCATGPSRELDAEIHSIVRHWTDGDRPAPFYTASIDDAMTLVPTQYGWWAEIHHRPDSPGVVLWQFPQPCGRIPADKPYQIGGRTAVLALCIAALKARTMAKS